MYIKLHVEGINNGLLTAITGDDWKVLTALAMYIDRDGRCYPTQDQIAELCGLSRATVNRRIGRLAELEFDGVKILSKQQVRHNGGFSNNVYVLHPALFSVF